MKTQNANPTKTQKKAGKVDTATLKVLADKAKATLIKKDPNPGKDRSTYQKEKNYIYKFQISNPGMPDRDAKKLRNKLRRKMENIVNAIIIEKKDNTNNIKAFIKYYKDNYILNDLSLLSLTNSKDETLIEDFNRVIATTKATHNVVPKK